MVERLSISLDAASKEKLEKLKKMTGKSSSEIIRELIDLGYDIYRFGVDSQSLEAWVDYLAKRQHMILDIEHWRVIFSEIENSDNNHFWRQMEEIGLSHAMQYKMKGLDTVEKILRYVEKANWYEIKEEGGGVYTLILNDLKIKRFVRTFLEKVFEGQNIKAEIKEGFGKLIVIER
uniref:Ribbon-helix-helix protein, CopG family n=1 Tax=Archaeoglobus fulgidus TaxID=2234 RepID=A0A7C2NDE7_ARCFL